MINRKAFFDAVRPRLFSGAMAQAQVDGLEVLLTTWERDYRDEVTISQLAYILATAYHETARTMQPVKEFGGAAYLANNYDVTGKNPERARKHGNDKVGDGIKYAGRGYVQLTWKNNYRRMGQLLGVDLVAFPDRAMEPVLAARIMFDGMVDGIFTGRKLTDYIKGDLVDYVNVRRIVNGTDRAELIAGYARQFEAALRASHVTGVVTKPASPVTPPDPPPVEWKPNNTKPGFVSRFFSALVARLLKRG
jgi:predicted chitinase